MPDDDTSRYFFFFFFNDTATTEIYTLSLHDALPISAPHVRSVPYPSVWLRCGGRRVSLVGSMKREPPVLALRSEEHTSELQSQSNLVCRLLLEKKKNKITSSSLVAPVSDSLSTVDLH